MIVGRGMLARAFAEYRESSDVVVFAAGVSDSLTEQEAEYQRELDLLQSHLHEGMHRLFVYFSTCSVADPHRQATRYVTHKLHVESIIKQQRPRYLILRLPVVVGDSKSKRTFPHQLYKKVLSGEEMTLWRNAKRFPIDVDDVVRITRRLIGDATHHNQLINIALKSFDAVEITKAMELILGLKANYRIVDEGSEYDLDIQTAVNIAHELDIKMEEDYLTKVLAKYFKQPTQIEDSH